MKAVLILLMMAVLLVYPSAASDAARSALYIWGLDVAPSLFPFMVLSQMLSARISRHARASFLLSVPLGLLGGSPSASASLAAFAEASPIPPRRLLSISALTGTISPMFFLGTVSIWLGSKSEAQKLLIAHFSGALIACILVYLFSARASLRSGSFAASEAVRAQNPVSQSVLSVLNVGGCIVFYSVAAACLELVFPSLSQETAALVHAAMEVSGGLRALCAATLDKSVRLVLLAAASGFSGLSIIAQNSLFLSPLGVTTGHLLLFALLRAAGAALVMAILL